MKRQRREEDFNPSSSAISPAGKSKHMGGKASSAFWEDDGDEDAHSQEYNDDAHWEGRGGEFGHQALPVGDLSADFDGVPTDGEQYLAMVRREAEQHGRAGGKRQNEFSKQVAGPASPEELLSSPQDLDVRVRTCEITSIPAIPSTRWRATYVNRFKALREAVSTTPTRPITNPNFGKLPQKGRVDQWYEFVHRRAIPNGVRIEVDGDDWEASNYATHESQRQREQAQARLDPTRRYSNGTDAAGGHVLPREPSASLMKRLQSYHILQLLTIFPYWFNLPLPAHASNEDVYNVNAPQALHQLYANWLFSLLAFLDHRLTSDEISILRTLARACIAAVALHRAKRAAKAKRHKSASLAGTWEEEQQRMEGEEGAWCVVAAVVGVWGQQDLWDDALAILKDASAGDGGGDDVDMEQDHDNEVDLLSR
ncbi:hypothetical protein IE81DRAFT_320224 [Ceraceosorus guamensis]|uniref:Uncharacterized protein n=1 Tax=Ceraceosorus guamensis TaxID=1522189 RepID=A0A316W6P7_9BASI|nr:hypothetical protein IE81DRAFT_320224 [Ceraceosorus guamensis]PWN45462.1 hypothetical protein IE81DRAFT_320224 [Ceraceosorus guamensis]